MRRCSGAGPLMLVAQETARRQTAAQPGSAPAKAELAEFGLRNVPRKTSVCVEGGHQLIYCGGGRQSVRMHVLFKFCQQIANAGSEAGTQAFGEHYVHPANPLTGSAFTEFA